MQKQRRILISPLEWGLGHATRCIPIIDALLELGVQVVIAANGSGKIVLQSHFKQCEFIDIPKYNIAYSANGAMTIKLLLQIPGIMYSAIQEHTTLKRIIKKHRIDGVISDNRFGLWSTSIPSVYITHQLQIMPPKRWKIFKPLLLKLHQHIIKRFDICWVPDIKEDYGLSGELGHVTNTTAHTHYIGILSRFSNCENRLPTEEHFVAIVSGPEPQRTIFENVLYEQMQMLQTRCTIISGRPDITRKQQKGHISIIPHLTDREMRQLICTASVIICRPGYSSMMDLYRLNRRAVIVPTPGQTEQEYLADYYQGKGWHYVMKQGNLNLLKASKELTNLHPCSITESSGALKQFLESFLNIL